MHVDDVIKKSFEKKLLNDNIYINDCDNHTNKKNELKKKNIRLKSSLEIV